MTYMHAFHIKDKLVKYQEYSVLLFNKGYRANMYDELFCFFPTFIAELTRVPHAENITAQKGTATSNCDKKQKVEVLALHPECQNGRVSCLFPAGIHTEFKAYIR